jgi:hypothetical protein
MAPISWPYEYQTKRDRIACLNTTEGPTPLFVDSPNSFGESGECPSDGQEPLDHRHRLGRGGQQLIMA